MRASARQARALTEFAPVTWVPRDAVVRRLRRKFTLLLRAVEVKCSTPISGWKCLKLLVFDGIETCSSLTHRTSTETSVNSVAVPRGFTATIR